jgi:hypothetical protein
VVVEKVGGLLLASLRPKGSSARRPPRGSRTDAEPRRIPGLDDRGKCPSGLHPLGSLGSPHLPLRKCVLSSNFMAVHAETRGWDEERSENSVQLSKHVSRVGTLHDRYTLERQNKPSPGEN